MHGWCLAGGTELAAACDLVYVADDAQIGYPPVRLMSPPDMQWQTWLMGLRRGMEALLTGDAMSGTEAVAAGMANRAHPADELDDAVLAVAERVAKIPVELLALNKRVSAPGDGGDGHPCRHPRDRRHPGARLPSAALDRVPQVVRRGGRFQSAQRSRRRVQRLPRKGFDRSTHEHASNEH